MLLRNKRFSAKVCYGWGRSLSSATTLILLTREMIIHSYMFYLVNLFQVWFSMSETLVLRIIAVLLLHLGKPIN
jgi:hypothetical protein